MGGSSDLHAVDEGDLVQAEHDGVGHVDVDAAGRVEVLLDDERARDRRRRSSGSDASCAAYRMFATMSRICAIVSSVSSTPSGFAAAPKRCGERRVDLPRDERARARHRDVAQRLERLAALTSCTS
jgi:hypothetical protein